MLLGLCEMADQIPLSVLRPDLIILIVGVLVAAAGVLACAVFLLRSRQRDWPLLYFGRVGEPPAFAGAFRGGNSSARRDGRKEQAPPLQVRAAVLAFYT